MRFLFDIFFAVALWNIWGGVKRIAERVSSELDQSNFTGLVIVAALACGSVSAQEAGASSEPVTNPPLQAMHVPADVREFCRNYDGSCVQCSLVMVGMNCSDPNASRLLWDSDFGPAERGGSDPSRVESYCNRRGIRCWSVTGRTADDTIPWLEWACRTGRFAAIKAGHQHFQTLYGFDPDTRTWFVCNNNSPQRVDRYSDQDFRRLHAGDNNGPTWCVILVQPSSSPPEIRRWWD